MLLHSVTKEVVITKTQNRQHHCVIDPTPRINTNHKVDNIIELLIRLQEPVRPNPTRLTWKIINMIYNKDNAEELKYREIKEPQKTTHQIISCPSLQ